MIDIFFLPDPAILGYQIEQIGKSLKSIHEPLKRSIQQVMAPSFQKNFDVGGRPSWADLQPTTTERFKKRGGGGALVATGTLKRKAGQLNIWTIDGPGGMASVDTVPGAEYGMFHQDGTRHFPARPWAVFQQEDMDDIIEVFGKWIDERFSNVF